jgi:putative DNA primase/helicase
MKSESAGKLAAIIELAKSEKNVTIQSQQLDQNNNLLNCTNGTLNLDTGELLPHRREDYITKSISGKYDPAATSPTWEKFLNDIFQKDKDLIAYVQRAIGYCLSGSTAEQKFFICYGNGRNGKSTLLKHIMAVLGSSYSTGTPAETMLEATGNTLHAIASIKAMRLVVLNEFDEGKTLSSAQVKTLTGGEPVVARHLYHEQFVYIPTYKFFMTTNHKPRIKDTSLGIWRRLVLLPFDFTVAQDKVDPNLDSKLAAEYEGILAWAVQGYRQWADVGLGALERLNKEALCYQGQSDLIGQFLEDSLDLGADPNESTTVVVDFIKSLGEWCRENGIRHAPGRGAVIDYISRKGYGYPERDNTAMVRGKMVWKGLKLKPEFGHMGKGEISWQD